MHFEPQATSKLSRPAKEYGFNEGEDGVTPEIDEVDEIDGFTVVDIAITQTTTRAEDNGRRSQKRSRPLSVDEIECSRVGRGWARGR